jgi:hypothetical protein
MNEVVHATDEDEDAKERHEGNRDGKSSGKADDEQKDNHRSQDEAHVSLAEGPATKA